MDCASVREDLLDVLYGEASPPARARVEAHARECGACRGELASLQATRRQLQAWELPASLGVARRASWRPRPATLAWAASIALAFGAGIALARAGAGAEAARVEGMLAAQEARHREEIQAVQARAALPSDEVLRHVERLVAEAETRQARRIDAQLVSFGARVDEKRREDLQRVSAGLALLEGRTSHDLARATELMGYVLQASSQDPR